jgi:hypothetical protein
MTRKERIDHWTAAVAAVARDYKRLDGACEAALKAGAMGFDGPLYEAVWAGWANMLRRYDATGWMQWFVFENECGARGLAAQGCRDKSMRPVRTARQLARIIVQEEDGSTNDKKI